MEGRRFGKLVVLEEDVSADRRGVHWICRCDCGGTRSAKGSKLREGMVQSCGCLLHPKKHGASIAGSELKSTYIVWCSIKDRCFNERSKSYARYGAVGITMCDEWRSSFEAFLAHIGPRLSVHHSIDRIDNNVGYQPGNVRWATIAEQNRNKKSNRWVFVDGKKLCTEDAARALGIEGSTIRARLNLGWSAEKAVNTPLAKKYSHKKTRSWAASSPRVNASITR